MTLHLGKGRSLAAAVVTANPFVDQPGWAAATWN
jgi:hypothetical protein